MPHSHLSSLQKTRLNETGPQPPTQKSATAVYKTDILPFDDMPTIIAFGLPADPNTYPIPQVSGFYTPSHSAQQNRYNIPVCRLHAAADCRRLVCVLLTELDDELLPTCSSSGPARLLVTSRRFVKYDESLPVVDIIWRREAERREREHANAVGGFWVLRRGGVLSQSAGTVKTRPIGAPRDQEI